MTYKKTLSLFILTLSFVFFALFLLIYPKSTVSAEADIKSQQQSSEPEYMSDTILVKFKEEVSNELRSKMIKIEKENMPSKKEIDLSKSESKNTGVTELNQIAQDENFKKIETTFSADNTSVKEKARGAKNQLSLWYTIKLNTDSKAVKKNSEEFRRLEKIVEKLKRIEGVEYVNLNGLLKSQSTPNDTYYSSNQYAPQLIEADDAWDITTGSGVKVAVIDSGITIHSDLNANVSSTFIDYTGTNIQDVNGHGSHVAGIIAGVMNNSYGIAGIAPSATLLIVKTAHNSNNNMNYVADGIEWAADHDAAVINMSLGGDFNCNSGYQFMQDAIDYAYADDVVIVAAAGNDGANDVHMPANCNHVISVANTDSSDAKHSSSNYGTAVDIAAPGTSIYSTLLSNTFGNSTGTSMASPHVAAVAALVKSVNPTFTADQVTTRVLTTADGITGTWTNWSNGRVNARRAVSPPTGTISASANPCQIQSGSSTCTSTISWSTGNNPGYVSVGVRQNPGTYIATGQTSGSVAVNWITTSGATFDLYSNGYFIGSVHVTGNPPSSSISASPNPCTLSGGVCTSAITWNTAGYSSVTVKVRETSGLFAAAPSGTQNAPWIYSGGYHFDLYSGTTLLKSVLVTGQ